MSHVKSHAVLMHQHAKECQNMPKGEMKQNWVGQSWLGSWFGSSLMAPELNRLQCFQWQCPICYCQVKQEHKDKLCVVSCLSPLHHFLMVETGHVSKILCQTHNICSCFPKKIVAICWIVEILCCRAQWNHKEEPISDGELDTHPSHHGGESPSSFSFVAVKNEIVVCNMC